MCRFWRVKKSFFSLFRLIAKLYKACITRYKSRWTTTSCNFYFLLKNILRYYYHRNVTINYMSPMFFYHSFTGVKEIWDCAYHFLWYSQLYKVIILVKKCSMIILFIISSSRTVHLQTKPEMNAISFRNAKHQINLIIKNNYHITN